MESFSFKVWARVSGTISVFWVAFYSKYYSLGDPGDPIGLVTFLCPFLITHWFVRRTPYLEKSPQNLLYPLLPLAGVALAMILASLFHGQSILHAQGPSLWLWAIAIILITRHWKFDFIRALSTRALFCYGLYFLVVQHPLVYRPSSEAIHYLYENQNILSFYLGGLFFLSTIAGNLVKGTAFVIVLICAAFIYNGSIFGTASFIAGLFVLAGFERYLFPILFLLGGSGLILKQFILEGSDAVQVRLSIWVEGLRQGMENMFFGAGHGHKIFVDLRPGFRLDHPHNFLVQGFRVAGAFGLAALIGLIAFIFRAWKKLHLQQRGFLTFFLFWSLADDWFMWHGTILLFAFGCTHFRQEGATTRGEQCN